MSPAQEIVIIPINGTGLPNKGTAIPSSLKLSEEHTSHIGRIRWGLSAETCQLLIEINKLSPELCKDLGIPKGPEREHATSILLDSKKSISQSKFLRSSCDAGKLECCWSTVVVPFRCRNRQGRLGKIAIILIDGVLVVLSTHPEGVKQVIQANETHDFLGCLDLSDNICACPRCCCICWTKAVGIGTE